MFMYMYSRHQWRRSPPNEVQSSMYVMGLEAPYCFQRCTALKCNACWNEATRIFEVWTMGYRIFVFAYLRMAEVRRARPKADPGKRVDPDRTPATGFDVA